MVIGRLRAWRRGRALSQEALVEEWFSCLDVLCPDFAPWIPDLGRAVTPELVIRVPLEGLPRVTFEDGAGRRLPLDERVFDWLRSASCCTPLGFLVDGEVDA